MAAAGGSSSVSFLLATLLLLPALAGAIELTAAEARGKRLYTEGVAASGAVVSARVGAAGTLVPGRLLPCANCHGSDARGRPEGGIRPPVITWQELTKPYGHIHETGSGRRHPAFDGASFVRAITEGRDPAGNRLEPAMPRYTLAASDVADLMAYLQRVDEDHDPGIACDRLRVATLLPKSGPLAGAGASIEAVLRGALEDANRAGGVHGRQLDLVVVDAGSDAEQARAAWDRLLRESNAFAVLAPLVPALEAELPELADAAALPLVALPAHRAMGEAPRFSFYPLAGLGEQLQGLAQEARSDPGLANGPLAVVMRPGDEAERNLARQLEGWLQRPLLRLVLDGGGREDAASVDGPTTTRAGDGNAAARLEAQVGALRRQGVVGVFVLGRDSDVTAFLAAADTVSWRPRLFLPAAAAGALLRGVPAAWTQRVVVALPNLSADVSPVGHAALARIRRANDLPARQGALQAHAYAVANIFLEGLRRSGRATSRGRLVEALEGLHDFDSGVVPAVGFGPGRRNGASGVHLVMPAAPGQAPASRFVRLQGGAS